MPFIIQTAPFRTVKAGEVATKYVLVQADNKFSFRVSPEDATVFDNVPLALQAIGKRAVALQKQKNYGQTARITDELTLTEVEVVTPVPVRSSIRVGRPMNGHPKVSGSYRYR
jgi:hypothetical protein